MDNLRKRVLKGGKSMPIGTVLDFHYTGAAEEITLGPGKYLLQCWGAAGGIPSTVPFSVYNQSEQQRLNFKYRYCLPNQEITSGTSGYFGLGAKGGYSSGTLTLSEDTNIYIYVGQGGIGQNYISELSEYVQPSQLASGSFNGGGGTTYGDDCPSYQGTGGGGTDIRIGTDSLYSRVIVAGGGGGTGSSSSYPGGAGGGDRGKDGTKRSTSYLAGAGGTQTSAGASSSKIGRGTFSQAGFGYGASNLSNRNYGLTVSGGGGGWYGGGVGNNGGSGGGSGFVWNSAHAGNVPSGYLLSSEYYLINATTQDGAISCPRWDENTTAAGNIGNGYVRITRTA